MTVSGDFPNGIKFVGTEGWIFVSRGNEAVTASDPACEAEGRAGARRQRSEDPHVGHRPRRGPPLESTDHHGNWLECVRSRQQPIAPVGSRPPRLLDLPAAPHRDEAGRKLFWDPVKERFKNDDDANAMLSRPMRWPYVYIE